MQKQATNTAQIISATLLSAILLFGVGGMVIYALEDEITYQPDELYLDECGACHYAYPPGLLPAASWQGIMASLDDHFEDNAETDEETANYVTNYLVQNSLRPGGNPKWSVLLRNIPQNPPLRIVELPGFQQAHESELELIEDLDMGWEFFSPCADCHRQADQGLFDKELLRGGYGPTSR